MFDTPLIVTFVSPNLNKSVVVSVENRGVIRLSGNKFSVCCGCVLHWVLAGNLVTDGYIRLYTVFYHLFECVFVFCVLQRLLTIHI